MDAERLGGFEARSRYRKARSAAPAIPKPFSVSWSFSATLFLTFGLPNLLQKSSSASFAHQ